MRSRRRRRSWREKGKEGMRLGRRSRRRRTKKRKRGEEEDIPSFNPIGREPKV